MLVAASLLFLALEVAVMVAVVAVPVQRVMDRLLVCCIRMRELHGPMCPRVHACPCACACVHVCVYARVSARAPRTIGSRGSGRALRLALRSAHTCSSSREFT